MVNFQSMERYSFQDLNRIMALLRQPGGCPWDREQTHESIRRNMLEEAYEAVEAIDEKDPGHLKEELGDVLLQVVFHARMAEEEGLFTLDDVVDGICKKLVFRHPHVFGTVDARDSGQALNTWDAQKREEKGQRTAADTLDSVARSLPALMRAEKIQDKARKAGFDWAEMGPALDKAVSCARPWNRGPMWRRSWATCSSPPSRWAALQGWTVSRPCTAPVKSLSAASGGWRSWPEDGRWTAWDCTGWRSCGSRPSRMRLKG